MAPQAEKTAASRRKFLTGAAATAAGATAAIAAPNISRAQTTTIKMQGAWAPQDRVPSENALVREFGVARMTVNRAVRELAQEGFLTRVKGGGTYVYRVCVADGSVCSNTAAVTF